MNIGDKHQGYEVIANIENEYILAYSRTAPSPFVTWCLDFDGSPYAGHYFSNKKDAITDFISRGWTV